MIVFLILVVIQSANAVVPMIREQDPMLVAIDDIAGLLYQVPEYEDPELIEHQLEHSLGEMPVFTLLEVAKKQANSKDGAAQKEKLLETKKAIDDIICKLQETVSKLEVGIDSVYPDIQKSIKNLKTLERSYRPDVRQLLRKAMSIAKPLIMPDTLEPHSTKRPAELQQVTAVPETYDHQKLSVRVISSFKSVSDEPSKPINPIDASEPSNENSKEDDISSYEKTTEDANIDKEAYEKPEEGASSKITEEEVKSIYVPAGYSKYSEDYAPKKSQYESDAFKKSNKKFEDNEQMTLFQPKWSWKSEQLL